MTNSDGMTSNLLPPDEAQRPLGFGREVSTDHVASTRERQAALLRYFRPELLNRVDEVIVFEALGPSQLAEIARRRIALVQTRLMTEHQIELQVPESAVKLIVRKCDDVEGDARAVHRVVSRLLEQPLSRALLAGEIRPGDRLMSQPAPAGDSLLILHDGRHDGRAP